MSSLSTNAMHIAGGSDSKPTAAVNNSAPQGPRLPYSGSINRFLADQDQRPPVGLSPVQTQEEAEAAGEARMVANLRAFDAQFGPGGQATGN